MSSPAPRPLTVQHSEEQLRAILEHAADGIMTTDERGVILSANRAAARIFGYNVDEVLGRNIRLLIPRPYLREHESYRPAAAVRSSVISRGREVAGRHKDGHTLPIDLSVSELVADTRQMFTAIVRDITERKKAKQELTSSREQLRSLAARLQSIREEERTRISREIHDELGQSLTGVKMDLAWLHTKLPADRPDLAQRLQSVTVLVDQTIQSVRKIAAELRPGILDNLGLAAALEWQAAEFEARTGLQCRCTTRLPGEAPAAATATELFRIFQETLTNVIRHSRATAVEASLTGDDNEIRLVVRDNGRGITEHQAVGTKSLGLLGMRERTLLLRGKFRIHGQPHHGTTVTVTVPRH